MDDWIELTLWLPVFVVPFILFGLIVFLSVPLIIIRRNRRAIAELQHIIEETQSRIPASKEKEAEWASTIKAYRNFLYTVSHETANPLQSIQTNLDNLVIFVPANQEEWQPYYQSIIKEIRRLGRLTDNLRVLSHLDTQKTPTALQVVNLKAIIEEAIISRSPEAEQKGVNLVFMGPEEPLQTMGNRDQLLQVFLNLVDNSIKFSQKEGTLVTIHVEIVDGMHCVRVSDEGIGIAAEDLPHVFDAAYRSPNAWSYRRSGSGLGLNIAKRIVEQHGGNIHIESQLGLGTVVRFDLPFLAPDD